MTESQAEAMLSVKWGSVAVVIAYIISKIYTSIISRKEKL